MTPRTVILLIVLAVAALMSWYLARTNQHEAAAKSSLAPVARGYYLTNARILGTDTDGSLLYEIRARHAEQQSDQQVRFSVVDIEYSPAAEVPWSVSADSAMISPDQREILLHGNVHASSERGFSGDETDVFTESLTLQPDLYTAATDERVRIQIGERTLSGTGMLAFLKENRLELKSNVNGRFVP
ncbi:MAG TPA: LPS export ABC transporter periplasmic protein LptC [Woeseiaceae bacterium]|nr:LPS export ABC transporter periplasmic protein LptC [Woeseiaceae bacterium]